MRNARVPWLGDHAGGWDHVCFRVELLHDRRIGASEITVYAGIGAHANRHTATADVSRATLATYARCSQHVVIQAIAALEATKWIEVNRRKGKRSIYRLLPPPGLSLVASPVDSPVDNPWIQGVLTLDQNPRPARLTRDTRASHAREQETDRYKSTPERKEIDALTQRLSDSCTGRNTVQEATAVMSMLRQFVDDRLIDEAVGWILAEAQQRPRRPRYYLAMVVDRARASGVLVPDLKLEATAS